MYKYKIVICCASEFPFNFVGSLAGLFIQQFYDNLLMYRHTYMHTQ